MTRYARLKQMKDNFIHAAVNAEDNDMIAMWIVRAEDCQRKMDSLTIEEAMREVK